MSALFRSCFLLWAPLAAAAACDPVVDDAIAALGPENPQVRRGPLHRPGQPCLLCHDGAIGDPPAFSVAGTIYEHPSSTVGLPGVQIMMSDSTGPSPVQPITNDAGNFYITPEQWTPTFPISGVVLNPISGNLVHMKSSIGRDGSCATCHFAPSGRPGSAPEWGPNTPGQVVVALDEGGTPP